MTGKNEQQNSSENNNIPTTALTSSRSGRTVNNGLEIPPLPPPGGDEGGDASPFVQTGIARKNLQAASVTYLDGGAHAFYVHKNSTAEVLFEMVCAHLGLNEKDYFGLFFYDEQATRHTLYKDKVITKQLKALPWRFFFEVKFYPSQPTQLAEDLTRYLLRLQLRQDVFEERLPTSFAMQAKLGALSAQAQFGDYQPTDTYAQFLRGAEFAQVVTEQLLEKIVDLHKQYRGLTPSEAELAYLNECKDLAMYGVILHPAKDSKSKPTQIGVSAHGISVYNDQMRVHRFAWPNIIKFSYRRNVFSVKLKPGELEKKDTTATYKLADYPSAKRLWKCAVEHHTFFRLIQTESKPKSSLLRFGSSRFRYYGRTNFQTQMASQLFDGTQSARVTSKSFDNIATREHEIQPTATLDSTSRDLTGSLLRDGGKMMVYETSTARSARVDVNSFKVGGQYAPHDDEANTALVSTPAGTATFATAGTGHLTKMSALTTISTTTATADNAHWNTVSKYDSVNDSLTVHTTSYSTHVAGGDTIAFASDSMNKDEPFYSYRPPSPSSPYYSVSSRCHYGLANNSYSTPRSSYYSQTQFNDSGYYASASSPDADLTYSFTSAYSPVSRNEMGLAESTITDIFMTPLYISPATAASKPEEFSPYESDLPKAKGLLQRDTVKTRISDRLKPKQSRSRCGDTVLWTLDKIPELPLIPLKARVTVYNSGCYDRAIQNDLNFLGSTTGFVKSRNPSSVKRITTGARFLKSKEIIMMDRDYMHRNNDIMWHPLKYFVRTYHSGFSVDPQRYSYKRVNKEEFCTKANKDDYKTEFINTEHQRLEKTEELESLAIEYHVQNLRPLKCHQYDLGKKSNKEAQDYSALVNSNNKKKCNIIITTSKLPYVETTGRIKNVFTNKCTRESVAKKLSTSKEEIYKMQVALPKGINDLFDEKNEAIIRAKTPENVQAGREQKNEIEKITSMHGEASKRTSKLIKKQQAILTISRKPSAKICKKQLSEANTEDMNLPAIPKLLHTDISETLESHETTEEKDAIFTPTTSSYKSVKPYITKNEKIREREAIQLRTKRQKSKAVLILKRPILADVDLKANKQDTIDVTGNVNKAPLRPVDEDLKSNIISDELENKSHRHHCDITLKTSRDYTLSYMEQTMKASTSELQEANELSDSEETKKVLLTKKLKEILFIQSKDSSKQLRVDDEYKGQEGEEQEILAGKEMQKPTKINKKSKAVHTLKSTRKEIPQTENIQKMNDSEVPQSSINSMRTASRSTKVSLLSSKIKNEKTPPSTQKVKCKAIITLKNTNQIDSKTSKKPSDSIIKNIDTTTMPKEGTLTKLQRRKSLLGVKSKKATRTQQINERNKAIAECNETAIETQDILPITNDSIKQDITKMSIGELVPCKKSKVVLTINTFEPRKSETIDNCGPHKSAKLTEGATLTKFDKMHKLKAIITLKKSSQVYDAKKTISDVTGTVKTKEVDNVSLEETSEKNQKETKLLTNKRTAIVVSKKTKKLEKETKNEANNVECFMKLKDTEEIKDKTIAANRHSQNISRNENIKRMIETAYRIYSESASHGQPVGRKQKAIITVKPVSEMKSIIGTVPKPNIDFIPKYVNVEKQKNTNKKKSHKTFDETISATLDYAIIDSGPSTDKIKETSIVDASIPRKPKKVQQTNNKKIKAILTKKPVANIEIKKLRRKSEVENKSPTAQIHCKNSTLKSIVPKKGKALLTLKRSQKIVKASELSEEMTSKNSSVDPDNKIARSVGADYVHPQKEKPIIRKSKNVETNGKKKAVIKLMQSNINNTEMKTRQTSKELCDTIAPISILDEIKEVKSTENTKPLKEIKRLIVHTTENVPIHTFDMNAQPRFDVRKKVAVLTLKSLKTAVISIKDNQAGKYSNEMIRKKQIDNKLRNNINETVELNRVNEELVKTKNVIPLNKDIKKQKVILKWRQPATSFMCLKKESLANPIQRITGDVKYILPEVRIQKPAICKVNMSKKQIAVLKLKQAAIDNKFSPVIAKTIVPERSAPIWETHLIKGIESTQLADTINIEKSYHKKKQIDVLNLKNVYYVKAEHIPERAETSEQVSRKDINTNRECNMAYVPVDANVGNVFKYNYGNRLRTKQTAMITLRKPIISEKINSIIENKEMPIELHSQRTKEEVDIDKPKVKKRLRSDIVNKKDKPIEIKSLRKQTLPITEPVAHRTTEKHNLKKKKAILTIAPTTFDHLCENAKTVKTNESHQTKETKSTSSIKHASELLEESTKSRKQKAVLTLQAIVHRSDTNNTIFPSTVNSEKVPDNEKNINYSCILPEIKEEKLLDVCVKSSNKKKQAVLKLRQSKMSAVYSRASQLEQNETVSEAYETRHANELMYKPFHVSAASRNHENITEKHKATLVLRKKALLLSLKEIRANVSAESFHSNKKNVSLKESSVGNLQFTESDNQRRKHKVIITLKDIFNTSAYQTYLETKKEARSHEGIIFTADKNKNKSVVDTKSAECEKISIIKTPLMQRIENNEVELPDESVIIEYVKVKPAQEVHSHTKPKAVLTIKLQKANQPIKLVSSKTINSRQMEHDGVVSTSRKKEKLTAVLTLQKFEVVKITELPRLQIKNKNSIRNTNEVKETSSKQKTKRNSFDANEMRFKKSKAILTLIQSRRHQGSMASKTKIAEKKLTTIHAMHRTLEIENVPINRFIDIKAKDNIVIQTTKENDPKKAIAFVSETTDVKQNQETACETFREHLLRTKTLHQKKKAIVTLKCLTRNNRNEAINMWNKIAAEKENESTICAGVVSKQSVIDKRHELVAKKHNAVLIMKTKYNKRTRIQDRNSCLSDVKTNEMSRGLDMPQFNIARNIQPFEFTQVKQPTVKKQKAIITQRQPKNLKNVEKPIMSKMMTSNVPILQTLSDNNEISPSSIIKDEKKIQEKKKRRAILTLRQKKSKSQSLGLMAMPSHKRVSKSIAVETDISLLAKRSFSETSSIIRDPDNVLQHVEILSKPIAVLYLKRKNKWINADYAYYANKSAQSTMRACKNQIRKKSADLKSVAQMSGFQSSECTMQSFADEFSDTKCTLNVSLMRCASYDFACTVFLGYRTRHFVPVGQRDGPVILPRSLFLDSLSSSNVFSFPAVDRNQQKGGNQSVRKTNEVVKDDKNESNETEEEEEEEDESEKYHEMGRNDNFLHNRKGLNAILCSAEKRRNKLSLLFQRDEVTSEKKETENKRVHGEDSWKESRKHNFFSINIKSGEQTNLLPFSSFSFFKSHDQLAAKQTHAKTSYDSAPTSYDEGSFSSDNSANKIQRSPVTYIVNKQIPAVLNVSTDKAEVNPVLFNPTVTMHSNNSTEGPTMRRSRSSILQSLLQKFSQKKSKNVGEGSIKKKEAKSKVEKAARKESGVDISSPSSTSSSSSSSSSDAEEVVEQPPQRNDIAEETERTGESPPYKLTSSVSAGPYALAPVDGRIIREETIEQVYRIVGGAGERIPHVDPANASLLGIVSKCVAETTSAPKVTYVEERSVVRDHGAIPDLIIKEASLPHSTVHTWHETSAGPETVTTEVDEHGNVVKRTVVKSEQVKHTVRTQSYQTFVVDENTAPNESSVTEKTPHSSPSKRSGISENTSSPPTTTTVAHTIAYENGAPADVTNTHQWTNGGAVRSTTSEFTEDDLVSTKAVTTGNRTVETLTYKKKKDGVMETHVEHRITIHGGDDIDHDAELSRAILEATNMNPEMTVEKVEVRQKKSIS